MDRRNFFKQSAKKALPLLAMVAFAGISKVSAQTTPMGCTGSCTGTCSNSCSGSCTGSCSGGCDGTCRGYCLGCSGGCSNTCSNTCVGGSAQCSY